jgi:hypothetical protein
LIDHLHVLFLFLSLRKDDQQIKNDEDKDKREQGSEKASLGPLRLLRLLEKSQTRAQ